MMPRNNVIQMWHAREVGPRPDFIVIEGGRDNLAFPPPPDIYRYPDYYTGPRYDTPSEQQRIANVIADEKRDLRVMRLQSFVKWGSIAVGYLTVLYFCFQMGRGL